MMCPECMVTVDNAQKLKKMMLSVQSKLKLAKATQNTSVVKEESEIQLKPVVAAETESKEDDRVFCQFCGDECESEESLAAHLSTLHQDEISGEGADVATCDFCGKVYPSKSIRYHLQTHKERKTQPCPICGKYVLSLKSHRRVHDASKAKRKEKCAVCGKECVYLQKHMLRHNQQRLSCEICQRQFLVKEALQRHMYTHGDDRVQCLFCPHVSVHESLSKRHMRNQHPLDYERLRAKQFTEQTIVKAAVTAGEDRATQADP